MREHWCGLRATQKLIPDKALWCFGRCDPIISGEDRTLTFDTMAQRIFVKVMGFNDVERHALNTLFRLSEQRETVYALWRPDAPEPPKLALIDGQSYEATVEFESPSNEGLQIIWIGSVVPVRAYRSFDRPLSWPEVIKAMDELFASPEALDIDLGFGDDTSPGEVAAAGPPARRALIAAASRDERLYLRAKLALADLTQADEAETGPQALELARANHYDLALVDFGLTGISGWDFLKELTQSRGSLRLIVTKERASIGEHIRARFSGIEGFFNKPPHPGRLADLLQKVH
ncbi:response regulator [Caenimonas koreensis DSM 17982]|uniref:Response regulator n=2 Tax=Caenimonas TaxID=763439 RepID=A0A844B1Y1_9BURK|nr:response regulator [Caenimonas koreensis DSM 17982]